MSSSTAVAGGPRARSAARPASRTQDLVLVACCAVALLGVVLDAWAHTNLSALEPFFTPWHGVLYSGFASAGAWVLWVGLRDIARTRRVAPGYGAALLGLVLVMLGGVGDGLWHTALGVEKGIEAQLSPTHLTVAAGAALLFATPARSSLARSGGARAAPVLLSATLTTLLATFVTLYLSAFAGIVAPLPGEPVAGPIAELERQTGVVAVLATTLLLLTPLLVLLRRGALPRGGATLLCTAVAVAAGAVDEWRYGATALAALAAGLAVDVLVARARGADPQALLRRVAVVLPLTLWAVYFAVVATAWGLRWPPELWTGSTLLATAAGAGLARLLAPDPA